MKKSFILLGIISLIVGGSWQKKQKQQEETVFSHDDYEIVDDDDDDSNRDDGYLRKFVPENYVQLNSALLAQAARSGMAAEYDSLCNAIAFASEIIDVSEEMSMPFGYELKDEDFYHDDIRFAEFLRWGKGMRTFRSLLTYAYNYRENNMEGLDNLIRRYGTLIKILVPYEKYVANDWEQTTIQLLTAYDDLSASGGDFGKISKIMDDVSGYFPEAFYEKLAPFARDKQMKAFINQKDGLKYLERGEINQNHFVWAYSFWGRRYNENPNNIPHLVAALKYLRNELYAPNTTPPVADKNIPPVEPYLKSDFKPGEQIYPWKMYTNRVKFSGYGGEEYEYLYIIAEQDGKRGRFISHWDDDFVVNRGDMIDLTWYMETMYNYDDDDDILKIKFSERVHSVKMVEPTATTRFENKYGALPIIVYDEDEIDDEALAVIRNKLITYLLETKETKISEALKIFGKSHDRLLIQITECREWYVDKPNYGHVIQFILCPEENDGWGDDDIIMNFIYNPKTDTLHTHIKIILG